MKKYMSVKEMGDLLGIKKTDRYWLLKKGYFKVCAVYHPSALLRDPSKREEMLKDMIEIKRVCDLCAGSL